MRQVIIFLLLLASALLTLSIPFPDSYAFDCFDDRTHADGLKLSSIWEVFTESHEPNDLGTASTLCEEDKTTGTLTCPIKWFRSGNTTTFTLKNGGNYATGTLEAPNGILRTFGFCEVAKTEFEN